MRSYTIYIDENLPPQLAKGLTLLTEKYNKTNGVTINVLSIKEEFGIGALDEEWIPKIGEKKGIVITQDFNIQKTKHQRELYKQNDVGILFLTSSKAGISYWEIVKLLIKRWDEITQIIKKNKTPFAYRCSSVNAKFEKLDY